MEMNNQLHAQDALHPGWVSVRYLEWKNQIAVNVISVNQITNSTAQNPSRKAYISSANHKILSLLYNHKIYYHFHNNPLQ
jgi:hypothetical protein